MVASYRHFTHESSFVLLSSRRRSGSRSRSSRRSRRRFLTLRFCQLALKPLHRHILGVISPLTIRQFLLQLRDFGFRLIKLRPQSRQLLVEFFDLLVFRRKSLRVRATGSRKSIGPFLPVETDPMSRFGFVPDLLDLLFQGTDLFRACRGECIGGFLLGANLGGSRGKAGVELLCAFFGRASCCPGLLNLTSECRPGRSVLMQELHCFQEILTSHAATPRSSSPTFAALHPLYALFLH